MNQANEVKGNLSDRRAGLLDSLCKGYDNPESFYFVCETEGSSIVSAVFTKTDTARLLLSCAHYMKAKSEPGNIIDMMSRGFPVNCPQCRGAA